MIYERNDIDFKRGTFRVNGDTIEIIPAYERKNGIRIELFGDEIERISEFDTLTGVILNDKKTISIFPASHFVTSDDKMKIAIQRIEAELKTRLEESSSGVTSSKFVDSKSKIPSSFPSSPSTLLGTTILTPAPFGLPIAETCNKSSVNTKSST